ncbi:MAG TPA: methyltransferase, partial [Chloroflexota bacterium]
ESTIEIAGRMMRLPAGSFFQTNLALLPAVIERMEERIAGREWQHAADVYGGVGTLGLPLARHVQHMTIVELDACAVEAARATASDWGLHNVEFVSRHAERTLSRETGFDLVIVDPPRSGLGEPVLVALQSSRPRLILYLSCSPASLSRDLAVLSASGYRVESLEIFDFYPQTYHVESLSILSL